jgi:hypothetical protein
VSSSTSLHYCEPIGPTDPGLSSALPRRPLPEILVKDLIKNIPNISFASNPCRIRFFTQEIVIYRSVRVSRQHCTVVDVNPVLFVREDLLKKMQRHTIVPLMTSEDAPEITEQIVQSILDQVTLFSYSSIAPLPRLTYFRGICHHSHSPLAQSIGILITP